MYTEGRPSPISTLISLFIIEICIGIIIGYYPCYGVEKESIIDENSATLKCDACMVVSKRFSKSFNNAQKDLKKPLTNEDYIEVAESTCDEDWSGYGPIIHDGISRLVGPDTELKSDKEIKTTEVWEHRLQDFCDELLTESPEEKNLFDIWSNNPSSGLDDYLCNGEGIFGACSSDEFGSWPGDDYEDYDDELIHDEF